MVLPFVCAVAACWSRIWPMPSAASSVSRPVPMRTLRFTVSSFNSRGPVISLPRWGPHPSAVARRLRASQWLKAVLADTLEPSPSRVSGTGRRVRAAVYNFRKVSTHQNATSPPLRTRGTQRKAFFSVSTVSPVVASFMVLFVLWQAAPHAHEIPNDVTVQAFLKPDGQRVQLLVRVPLLAMRDMDYPTPSRGSGLLDLSRADASLRDAATLWIADDIELYEEGNRLAYPRVVDVRASLASDRSFASYEEALAHVTGPRLPDNTEFLWNQGLLDILLEYPIQSEQSRFSIRLKLDRLGLRTVTVLRFLTPGGAVRAFEFLGDAGVVRLDPRWHQAALQFVKLGFLHILDGIDHLLFLLCLVIPFRRFRSLIAVVTSFTVAHSITLIASAYNFAPDALWFPPLIETLIATSIVYMALETIVYQAGGAPPPPNRLKRRWLITFGFGLVHGFGFSFALRQTLQFAGSHLL